MQHLEMCKWDGFLLPTWESTKAQGVQDLSDLVNQLSIFAEGTRCFWDFHSNNVFLENFRQRLDPDWLVPLKEASFEALLDCIVGKVPDNWPTSLADFITDCCSKRMQVVLLGGAPPSTTCKPACQQLSQAQASGMREKKKAEVEAMAQLVAHVAVEASANIVLDLGAGKGHLAHVLAAQYGLAVAALDSDARLAEAAGQQRRFLPQKNGRGLLYTTSIRLEADDALDRLSEIAAELSQEAQKMRAGRQPNAEHGNQAASGASSDVCGLECPPLRVVLVGLHACGDLTPTMLRVFKDWHLAVAVVSVGCCYNLLTEPADLFHHSSREGQPQGAAAAAGASAAVPTPTSIVTGFPMSSALVDAGVELGFFARLTACHSNERAHAYASLPHLATTMKQNATRAGLQYILRKHYPDVDPAMCRVGRNLKRRINRKRTAQRSGSSAEHDGSSCVAPCDSDSSSQPHVEDGSQSSISDLYQMDDHQEHLSGASSQQRNAPELSCSGTSSIKLAQRQAGQQHDHSSGRTGAQSQDGTVQQGSCGNVAACVQCPPEDCTCTVISDGHSHHNSAGLQACLPHGAYDARHDSVAASTHVQGPQTAHNTCDDSDTLQNTEVASTDGLCAELPVAAEICQGRLPDCAAACTKHDAESSCAHGQRSPEGQRHCEPITAGERHYVDGKEWPNEDTNPVLLPGAHQCDTGITAGVDMHQGLQKTDTDCGIHAAGPCGDVGMKSAPTSETAGPCSDHGVDRGPGEREQPAVSCSKAGGEGLWNRWYEEVGTQEAVDYITRCLAALGLEQRLPQQAMEEEWEAACAPDLRLLPALWMLRCVLGPPLESLLLLDRLQYLLQPMASSRSGESPRGVRAAVIHLFDPVASPRSTALVAMKIDKSESKEDTAK